MTIQEKEIVEKPRLKKDNLRYNEYYGTQEIFDDLYQQSKNDKDVKELMSLITSRKNILLAYRKIKRNKGSKTSGTNSTTIKEIGERGIDELIAYVRKRLKNYQPQPIRRVMIAKDDGRKRPLGIPSMEDRIIQ